MLSKKVLHVLLSQFDSIFTPIIGVGKDNVIELVGIPNEY